ncbi:MAG: FUSC family protein [Acidithiobacillus sp.]
MKILTSLTGSETPLPWWPDFQSWLVEQRNTWIFVAKTVLAALLTLWLAYRFNLESPSTAVTTVFIVMQSRNGMVLAKGFYRAMGTLVGSAVAVALVAAFAEERILFLIGLAVWVGLCTAGARYFRNFQAYAFVLAGYTAALVGLPAAANPLNTFDITITRVSDVLLGILVASVVSAIVLPQSMQALLLTTAQQRFQHFLETTLRVLQGGIPRNDWSSLHLKAIHEMVTLDSYRSSGVFESTRARQKNIHVQQMIAEMMSAASSLHLLNTHIRRMQHEPFRRVGRALQPLLTRWSKLLDNARIEVLQSSGPLVLAERLEILHAGMRTEIPQIRAQIQDSLTTEQRLGFDTAVMLLSRFLSEMTLFSNRYDALQGDCLLTPLQIAGRHFFHQERKYHQGALLDKPKTEITQPLTAALRSMVVVGLMSAFWLATAWPSGVSATIIAVVISALFSTFPNPVASVKQMMIGIIMAFSGALIFSFSVLPQIQGFTLLALGLMPFLIIGPYILSHPQWPGIAAGYGIFFPQLAIPDNIEPFSYSGLINNGMGELVAVATVGVAFMVIMPAGNWLERRRLFRALQMQVVAACRRSLKGLRSSFERDTRELLRQLVTDPSVASRQDADLLRAALCMQDLGEALIQLRILVPGSNNILRVLSPPEVSLAAAIQSAIKELETLYRTADIGRAADAIAAFDRCFALAEQLQEPDFKTSDNQLLGHKKLVLIYLHLIRKLLGSIQSTPGSAPPAPADATSETRHAT